MQESAPENYRLEKYFLRYCSNPSMSRTGQEGQIIIDHEDLLRRRFFRMRLRKNIQITLTSSKNIRLSFRLVLSSNLYYSEPL